MNLTDSLVLTDAVDELNGSLQATTGVVKYPSLAEVTDALENGTSVTIRIIAGVELGLPEDQSDIESLTTGPIAESLNRRGLSISIPIKAELLVSELSLETVTSLTRLADGGYTFTGTWHDTFAWERNYNAGWQHEHTYTDYSIAVEANGRATYKITNTRQNKFLN